MIQMILFTTVGTITLIMLPVLFGKRIFCGLICPFGAWQAFFGRINPFRVTINKGQCTECKLCIKSCPTFVLNETSLKEHAVNAYCNRCGECIDVCRSNAIQYTLMEKETNPNFSFKVINELARTDILFLFTVLIVGGSVGGVFVPTVLVRIARFLLQ